MDITELQVPLLYVGSLVVFAIRIVSSFNKLKEDVTIKFERLTHDNVIQDKARDDKFEKFELWCNGLNEKIEHRTSRLSGSIKQMQDHLEKQGEFMRRDPLYGDIEL